MRVLHLGKYYAPQRGGIERHTQALAEGCARKGDEVAVLVHQRPGDWRYADATIDRVRVLRSGCLGEWVHAPLSPLYPRDLARALAVVSPDLLHLHFPNPSCFFALANPAARRLPWVVHWHADVPPDSTDWRLRAAYRAYRPFERAVLARAQTVVATSQAYLEASSALLPWRDKAVVIPLGIAEEDASAATACALWPAEDGLRLLAVGRLSQYKGFDVLVEALVASKHATLLLVGSGECGDALRALARTRGVMERIHFVGDLDDDALRSAYASAQALVLPSIDRGEAFGLVLLEAMRASLPVVASAIVGSGVGSVVVDNETGLMVKPADSAALSMAIDRLQDASLRERLGRAGRARWQREFTLERSVERVRAVYRSALG